jgi:hypothetical protein
LDSSIVQGPFSVAPCQTLSRFATFSSLYAAGWVGGGVGCTRREPRGRLRGTRPQHAPRAAAVPGEPHALAAHQPGPHPGRRRDQRGDAARPRGAVRQRVPAGAVPPRHAAHVAGAPSGLSSTRVCLLSLSSTRVCLLSLCSSSPLCAL